MICSDLYSVLKDVLMVSVVAVVVMFLYGFCVGIITRCGEWWRGKPLTKQDAHKLRTLIEIYRGMRLDDVAPARAELNKWIDEHTDRSKW